MIRLARILERYGRAIEYDFLGKLDVPTLWRQRRIRFLLDMIGQLPAHSRYAEAVAQDDELAEEMFGGDQPDAPPPPLSSWSPEVAVLHTLVDRVGIMIQFLAVLSRNKYVPPEVPRPETAHRRVWLRRNLAGHRMRVARMLPVVDDREDSSDAVPG